MKIAFLTSLLIFCHFLKVFSQDVGLMGKALQTRESNYNRGYAAVKDDYDDLMGLELTNKYNQADLLEYQKNVKKWLSENSTQIDYSIEENVSRVRTFINGYKENKEIIREVELLFEIMKEVYKIKERHPDDFTGLSRYKEMKLLLMELRDCDVSLISKMAFEHDLF